MKIVHKLSVAGLVVLHTAKINLKRNNPGSRKLLTLFHVLMNLMLILLYIRALNRSTFWRTLAGAPGVAQVNKVIPYSPIAYVHPGISLYPSVKSPLPPSPHCPPPSCPPSPPPPSKRDRWTDISVLCILIHG